MRIGVDAAVLSVRDDRLKTGVYTMTKSLFTELIKIDRRNEYFMYSFENIADELLEENFPGVKNIVVKPKRAWNYLALPLQLIKKPVDIFIGPSQSLPWYGCRKSIAIIHDLAFELFPECYLNNRDRLHRVTKHTVRSSSLLVAVSQQTKHDLINIYNVDESKVRVMYEGVDPIFRPQRKASMRLIRKKYNLPEKYFLFIGSLKMIKNVNTIINAHSVFYKKHRPIPLVIVGSDIWIDQSIKKLMETTESGQIINLGYVPREDLPGLYAAALAFVSPSLYEGFGLPLVESMSCGTPVITSNLGAMKEVVGQVGLLIDPNDIKEITLAMHAIVDGQRRKQLSAKGLVRSKIFNWRVMAKEMLKEINKFQ